MTRFVLALFFAGALVAGDASSAIRQVLADQQAAWNRRDIEAFMQGYRNSPETTFIGTGVTKGHAAVLERYRKRYATGEAMGTLEFSEIEVKLLSKKHAVVTGRFHLERTAAGGGEATGIFSLIFENEPNGWKIILDHTS